MNDRVYTAIKERILNLEYEPGQALNPKGIAAELGVSQTPVREAFMRLEWEKLVSILPRLGIHVTTIDLKQLKEIYLTRMLIEGEVHQLAAQNITDEHLNDMKKLLTACERIMEKGAREKLVRLDKEFRDVIFKAANCLTLQEISERLYDQTLRVWHLTFDDQDVISEVKAECREIEETIAAFSKHEPSTAQRLRNEIITAWVDRLQKYYTRF